MAALEGDAENAGAIIAYQSSFIAARKQGAGYVASIVSQGEEMTLAVSSIVNAAGHGARQASLNIEGMNADAIRRIIWRRGSISPPPDGLPSGI